MACNMQNKVSIRLMSGGHAFSNNDIETIKNAGCDVVVEVVTPKTVLRPEEGFVLEEAQRDLEATGHVVAEDEVVVCSASLNGRVAIMAVSKRCARAIASLGVNLCYSSPLLLGDDMAEGSHIALYGDVLYVCVYKGGLRFAEAIHVENDADLLYYLESINRVYGIYNMYARAIGDRERLNRVCRKCFKTKL